MNWVDKWVAQIHMMPRLRCHPEVTSDQTKSNAHGVFPDQNYRVWDFVPAHNSMIRSHFGLGMVWSEVISVWGWYDQRSLRSGDGMIRGHFVLGMVWSEVTLVWGWYDQKTLQDGNGQIRGGFKRTLVWSETISSADFFFDLLQPKLIWLAVLSINYWIYDFNDKRSQFFLWLFSYY